MDEGAALSHVICRCEVKNAGVLRGYAVFEKQVKQVFPA